MLALEFVLNVRCCDPLGCHPALSSAACCLLPAVCWLSADPERPRDRDASRQIDELMFSCSAPAVVIALLHKLEPLKTDRFRSWRGLDHVAALSWFAAIMLAVCYTIVLLAPQQDSLRIGRNTLCGGNLDWVYTTMGGTGSQSWASTAPPNQAANVSTREWPGAERHAGRLSSKLTNLLGPLMGATGECATACWQGRAWTPLPPNASFDFGAPLDACCLAQQARFFAVTSGDFSLSNVAVTSTVTSFTNSRCVSRCRFIDLFVASMCCLAVRAAY
jgi:hypothetical protein